MGTEPPVPGDIWMPPPTSTHARAPHTCPGRHSLHDGTKSLNVKIREELPQEQPEDLATEPQTHWCVAFLWCQRQLRERRRQKQGDPWRASQPAGLGPRRQAREKNRGPWRKADAGLRRGRDELGASWNAGKKMGTGHKRWAQVTRTQEGRPLATAGTV